MIHIEIQRWAEGMALEAHGHAGHGAIGHDIVCAGVSALLYSLLAYLKERADACPTGHLDRSETEEGLYLRTRRIPEGEVAFAVITAGLRLMEGGFPEAVCLTVRGEPATNKEE